MLQSFPRAFFVPKRKQTALGVPPLRSASYCSILTKMHKTHQTLNKNTFPSSTLLPSHTSKSPWKLWIAPLRWKEPSETLCKEGGDAVSNAGMLQQQPEPGPRKSCPRAWPTSPDSLAAISDGSPDTHSSQAFPLKSSLTNFFPA